MYYIAMILFAVLNVLVGIWQIDVGTSGDTIQMLNLYVAIGNGMGAGWSLGLMAATLMRT